MAALIGVVLVSALMLLPRQLGKAKASKSVKELFGKSRGVNLLAAARVFLFGARGHLRCARFRCCWPSCSRFPACRGSTSSSLPALRFFGILFAVNSSLHSYLILAYAGSEKAAEDVGFYYAANAAGRLGSIVLSGLLYQMAGMMGCLAGSAAMLALCWLITLTLPKRAESFQPDRALQT